MSAASRTTASGLELKRHLLGLDGMSAQEMAGILDRAEQLASVASGESPPLDVLKHQTVALVFFEDSTRTRCSFTLAVRRLGGEVLDVGAKGSSSSKGESLLDTCLNLQAMGVRGFVIRTGASGAPHQTARQISLPIINAGDGRHEHPTQGLLDLLTIRNEFNRLNGLTVAIVGDIAHSRVARSALFGLTAFGSDVVLVGPSALVPETFMEITNGSGTVRVERDFDSVLPEVDVVMMLRVQFERDAGSSISSIEEYRHRYSMNAERSKQLPDHAIIMHPGPMNRGLEIESEVADDPDRSVILDQVKNGVAVRAAVLERCLAI